MSKLRLLRPCLGCGRTVRARTRCADCQAQLDKRKAARRPDLHNERAERERRRRAVADHRAIVGDWCPGWAQRPAHPSADLTADHVREVRLPGGRASGRLVVRCRSCNSAKANAIIARALGVSPRGTGPSTPTQSNGRLHSPPLDDGPVVA